MGSPAGGSQRWSKDAGKPARHRRVLRAIGLLDNATDVVAPTAFGASAEKASAARAARRGSGRVVGGGSAGRQLTVSRMARAAKKGHSEKAKTKAWPPHEGGRGSSPGGSRSSPGGSGGEAASGAWRTRAQSAGPWAAAPRAGSAGGGVGAFGSAFGPGDEIEQRLGVDWCLPDPQVHAATADLVLEHLLQVSL